MTRAKVEAENRKIEKAKIKSQEKMHAADVREKRFATESKLATDSAKAAGSIAGTIAKFNHPEWYKKFVSSNVNAMLPSYTRLGVRMAVDWITNTASQDNLPGICVINYQSTLPNIGGIGYSYQYSPINIGLARFMSELRKMNSRIGSYDASDFGLYWYAVVDVLYVLIKIGKCIQIYNTYVAENAYFAKALIYAEGFDADNFFANIQQYKSAYCKFVEMFNSNIVLPKSLTFAMRRAWMSDLLIKDHKGVKSQVYIFRQTHWGTLAEDEGSVTFGNYTSGQTYVSVTNYLDVAFQRLVDSVGIQTMIADLRAGIPEANFIKITPVDMSSTVDISESDVDLEQIHNLTTMPGFGNPTLTGLTIYAMATGYLAQGIPDGNLDQLNAPGPVYDYTNVAIDLSDSSTVSYLKKFYTDVAYLNFYKDDVNQDDILEATRLRHTIEQYSSIGVNYLVSNTRGTEIVSHLSLYYINPTNGTLTTVNTSTVDDYPSLSLSLLSRFDWIPIHMGCGRNASNQVTSWMSFGEVDNYFPISALNLKHLHAQCGLSEFFISSTEFNKGFTR